MRDVVQTLATIEVDNLRPSENRLTNGHRVGDETCRLHQSDDFVVAEFGSSKSQEGAENGVLRGLSQGLRPEVGNVDVRVGHGSHTHEGNGEVAPRGEVQRLVGASDSQAVDTVAMRQHLDQRTAGASLMPEREMGEIDDRHNRGLVVPRQHGTCLAHPNGVRVDGQEPVIRENPLEVLAGHNGRVAEDLSDRLEGNQRGQSHTALLGVTAVVDLEADGHDIPSLGERWLSPGGGAVKKTVPFRDIAT